MISYVAEDNEDTEPTFEKTYQDDLIPLQGELLNTEIAEPTITLIPKQEIDYRPEIVLAIPIDPQAKQLTLLRALVDSRSNKCHAKLSKMPKWIQDQALPTKDECPCYCTNSSNEWNVQLKGARRRRTSARTTANKEWDSSFALSLRSVGNKVLYTADQTIRRSDTLYSRRAITTRANTMTTTVHSIVHSND
jgi:hypothetical protein